MSVAFPLNASGLKRFFKDRFGVAVRVRSSRGVAGWIEAWIPSPHTTEFPDELGDRCAEIVYPGKGWRWCGNIGRRGITLTNSQWETLILQYAQPTPDAVEAR